MKSKLLVLFSLSVFVLFAKLILTPPSTPLSTPKLTPKPNPKLTRVLVLDFNPVIHSQNNTRLRKLKSWADPQTLESEYIRIVSKLSHGMINYSVIERISNIDMFLEKIDGFEYTETEYLNVINSHIEHHEPDIINYSKLIEKYDICQKVNSGQIDELWLWGGPWFGYYEAVMAGRDAYFTNALPIKNTPCNRNINIMGFSYERGVDEMLEDLGHRMEGVMAHVFNEDPRWEPSQKTEWGKFVSSYGWMHQPPNILYSLQQYIYDDPAVKPTPCSAWGCTKSGFESWWFNKLPAKWWDYLSN